MKDIENPLERDEEDRFSKAVTRAILQGVDKKLGGRVVSSTIPEVIFLQWTDDDLEVTWCRDRINDDDVQYVRVPDRRVEAPVLGDLWPDDPTAWDEYDEMVYSYFADGLIS